MQVRHPDLILISMPWAALHRTPIQLGILHAVVDRAGFKVESRSFFLKAMEHFSSATSAEETLTIHDYEGTSFEDWKCGLPDWIFAVPPYRATDHKLDEEYFSYLRSNAVSDEVITKAQRLR